MTMQETIRVYCTHVSESLGKTSAHYQLRYVEKQWGAFVKWLREGSPKDI